MQTILVLGVHIRMHSLDIRITLLHSLRVSKWTLDKLRLLHNISAKIRVSHTVAYHVTGSSEGRCDKMKVSMIVCGRRTCSQIGPGLLHTISTNTAQSSCSPALSPVLYHVTSSFPRLEIVQTHLFVCGGVVSVFSEAIERLPLASHSVSSTRLRRVEERDSLATNEPRLLPQ